MKILITGGQGMLGSALYHQCNQKKLPAIPLGKQEADITNLNHLRQVIQSILPSHIINTAAYTKVDLAETEQEHAFAVNAIGARNIATICQEQNIKLLHISTDYVFDGTKTAPYSESCPTTPLSVYGKTKAQGEVWVQKENPTAQIVRLQALYGDNGSHFVQTMLNLSKKSTPIKVVDDQFTSPSYTKHIADALLQLLSTSASGIFHLHNQGYCSWYEFAKEIFALEEKPIKITPVTSGYFHSVAPRPLNSRLSMKRWKELKISELPHWKQALQEYLRSQDHGYP